jgi:uncharacterized membrane protein
MLSVPFLVAMVIVAIYAYRRVAPGTDAIPMHWSLNGKVTWTAPRPIAFAFIPALAAAVMVLLAASGHADTRQGVFLAGAFLACELLHIALTQRWFTRRKG